ncbi:phosphotransferase [Kutzneria buriramensis]|uniref:Kanamycin kinase n=1 Tax=Kutzneria buriramensis TaxID=1045776 RepID=A0A3E0I5S8_9PSEU|nr:phosphotransferase [Kutzneria buriramensis]REH53886.1 kanamycin kinase [Kutzneria buriramensis]
MKPHEVVTHGHSGARVLRFLDGSGYLKSAVDGAAADLVDDERERLLWLRSRDVAVPAVIDAGRGWLHTAAVPGRPASDPWPPSSLDRVATIMGETLRRLHSLDPAGCPFGAGPVVGHGDYCLPNVIIADGSVHLIDVGRAGLLDPRSDIEDCLESIRGPFNPQFAEPHAQRFLAAYHG